MKNTIDDHKLYKYRCLTEANKESIEKIFSNQELYFASPDQLNDYTEGRPKIHAGNLDDIEAKRKLNEFTKKEMNKINPSLNKNKVSKWLNARPNSQTNRLLNKLEPIFHNYILKNFRIYSLSGKSTEPLMWAHYACDHSGFCLEFDTNNYVFRQAEKITYQDTYPSINIMEEDDYEILKQSILIKSERWRYEDEYRLISMEPSELDQLQIKNNIFIFPKEYLTSIIFGLRSKHETQDFIKNLCKKYNFKIKFKQIIEIPRSYELNVIDI